MIGHLRQATFRVELLDSSNNFIGDVAISMESTPSISHDTGRSINRTVSGLLLDPKITKSVNPYSDRLRFVMDIPGSPPKYLGTYLFGSSSIVVTSTGDIRSTAMVDQSFIASLPLENSVSIPTNTQITKAIQLVLSECGDFEFTVDESPIAVGPTPLTWRPGTTTLQVVNDLCAIIGYYPFYFNNSGIGVIQEQKDVLASAPDLIYNFGNEIYERSLVKEDRFIGAPNRYIVVDTSAMILPIVGTYDIPDAQPHSYVNRGFYVRELVEIQGLQTVPNANLVAKAIALRDTRQGKVTFSSPPSPLHDSYDVIEIEGTKYLEVGWSLSLVEGSAMQHSLIEVI